MKFGNYFAAVLVLVFLSSVVLATDTGVGISPDVTTEDFAPLVWMCDHRVMYDDATEPGRVSSDGEFLVERINNYAFEGEQIEWLVLVMDKNGIQKVVDVYGTIGTSQGEGNDIEVNCVRRNDVDFILDTNPLVPGGNLPASCNARILEERLLNFDENMMAFYTCTFTVETPDSMYGEYWITIEAIDLDGLLGTMEENEYWFLNPVVAVSVDGDLAFEDVRPGTSSYSDTLLIGNDADPSSGVILDMFITGTDFYDSSNSGAACPDTNQLQLFGPGSDGLQWTYDDTGFFYFATNGAYSTKFDHEIDMVHGGNRVCDDEGYCNIQYGIGFNNPAPFYQNAEIIQQVPVGVALPDVYWVANTLSPGAEMALTFRLDLPEPCNGDFDTGSIYFWAEAI